MFDNGRDTPLSNAIVRFLREVEGTELVEWGLIAGLIIVLAAGSFAAIGTDLSIIFGDVQTETCKAAGVSKGKSCKKKKKP